jgi:hypothetical protein
MAPWQRIWMIVLVVGASGLASQPRAKETPHLEFFTEYIRELAANEHARAAAAQELMAASTLNDKLLDGIHGSTVIQLELRAQMQMLKGMRLDSPFETLVPNIIEFYQQKIVLHQTMIDISSSVLDGPKPTVDYGKMTSEMPKIRASLDEIDHALFEATPMIFATLIDPKPDSLNHLSHLVITKSERDKLVSAITTTFGEKLDQNTQNYIVSSASVLKAYLLKGYKCADEPWQ